MELATWLIVLKFIGIAASAIFGTIGLLHDYKDDDGNITPWGRGALVGVIFSAGLTAASETIALIKGHNEAVEAQRRTLAQLQIQSTILKGIERGLNPFSDIRISGVFPIRMDSPALKGFV